MCFPCMHIPMELHIPLMLQTCSSPTDRTHGDVPHQRVIHFAHQEQHAARKPANGRTHQADTTNSPCLGSALSFRGVSSLGLLPFFTELGPGLSHNIYSQTSNLSHLPDAGSDSGPYPLLGSRQPAAPRHALQPSTDPLPTHLAYTLPRGINTGKTKGQQNP